MKLKKTNLRFPVGKSISGLKFCTAVVLLSMLLISCSAEEADVPPQETADLKLGVELETWQEQIERLEQKMRRFHNFQVASAQGWDTDLSGYVPNMGHHFINGTLADDKFELLKPEALIYIPDGSGGWEFVGVEYLIFGIGADEPAPEGFIGEEDVWFYNPHVSAWTLHAWIVRENPDGVFAAFNPNVPAAP